MLIIKNLSVSIGNNQILNNVSLAIKSGEAHAIMGPNGSGKSTLAYAIVGHPRCEVTSGAIFFEGKNITEMSVDMRARLGLFLSFQQPYEIPGVSVFTFLHEAYRASTNAKISVKKFEWLLKEKMSILKIDYAFEHRALNEGFSGGEKKRFELLQLLVLQPKCAILDEIDSGLDVDALKMVADGIKHARAQNPEMSILLITHYQRILKHVIPDMVHVLQNGTITNSGDALLADEIDRNGYNRPHASGFAKARHDRSSNTFSQTQRGKHGSSGSAEEDGLSGSAQTDVESGVTFTPKLSQGSERMDS